MLSHYVIRSRAPLTNDPANDLIRKEAEKAENLEMREGQEAGGLVEVEERSSWKKR